MEWINVKDKLPKIGERVLLLEEQNTDYYITIGCYQETNIHTLMTNGKKEKMFVDEQDEQPSIINATFWQPLPKAPNSVLMLYGVSQQSEPFCELEKIPDYCGNWLYGGRTCDGCGHYKQNCG